MNLYRLYAFTVKPSRTSRSSTPIEGGIVTITKELRKLINDSISTANFNKRSEIAFVTDQTTRTNPIRDNIISVAYNSDDLALAASYELASALSNAMDQRSLECLFIIAVQQNTNIRAVTLWTFPRDQAFRFNSSKGKPLIEVLTDVFSRTSNLRKAALYQGKQLRNDFMTGKVLDFQAGKSSNEIANYWLSKFLSSTLAIQSESGTRLLAKTLRQAHDVCDKRADREQFFVAMISIRAALRTRWSLKDFADQYLSGLAKVHFLEAIPNENTLVSSFEFNREIFDSSIKFRIFHLDSGVIVSSPLDEIGKSIKLTSEEPRQLSCEGIILDERLRIRHG